MPRAPRKLALTPAHVARIHREMPDTGPPEGFVPLVDADYARMVGDLLAQRHNPAAPLQIFAYGSLIWKPEVAHVAERPAAAHGWHRSFCLRIARFRGTPQVPGLMMALDRGGQCRGVVYDLPDDDPATLLDRLLRRECSVKPTSNTPRWLRVVTPDGPVQALGFVMNRAARNYAGRLALPEVAEVLARACGHWGTGAEYLMNTLTQLEARGIRDSRLWQLQALVAGAIERNTGPL